MDIFGYLIEMIMPIIMMILAFFGFGGLGRL
jgi:hypothetical protein